MENAAFFNAYVENLLAENNELNKTRILMKTQLDMLNVVIQKQDERIKELEAATADPDVPAEDIESKF